MMSSSLFMSSSLMLFSSRIMSSSLFMSSSLMLFSSSSSSRMMSSSLSMSSILDQGVPPWCFKSLWSSSLSSEGLV